MCENMGEKLTVTLLCRYMTNDKEEFFVYKGGASNHGHVTFNTTRINQHQIAMI